MEKINLHNKLKEIRKAINTSIHASALSIIVGSNPSYADTTYHVQFSWKPNFELEVKNGGGYNIYADENGGTTYTKRNSFQHNSICGAERCYATINDLDPSKSYRFVATAFDTQGNESDYSTAIPITGSGNSIDSN